MATTTSPSDTTLRLKRTFAAPREKVFQAWTDPKALKQWFAPSDDYSTPLVEVDLHIGGKYRIQMKAPDGALYIVKGIYREIKAPEKLVFTWAWEGGASCRREGLTEERETLVTVEFHDRGNATDLTLTHEYFPSVEEKDKHGHGWTGCLNQLEKVVNA